MDLSMLGLTENETAVYLYVYTHPGTTTGPIIKATKISTSQAYLVLSALLHRGLVTYTIQSDGKRFSSTDPETFLRLHDEQRSQIEEAVAQLSKMKQESTAQTFSTIYEGFSGFKTAFQKVIDDCPMGGTINIIGFSEEQYNVDSLRVFLRNMNLRAKQKKQKLRILLPISTQYTLGKDREKEPNTEVRYLVDGFVSPAAVDIVEDSVYTFLWDQKPYVFAIKNKKIADSYRSYFNSLWKQAKEN